MCLRDGGCDPSWPRSRWVYDLRAAVAPGISRWPGTDLRYALPDAAIDMVFEHQAMDQNHFHFDIGSEEPLFRTREHSAASILVGVRTSGSQQSNEYLYRTLTRCAALVCAENLLHYGVMNPVTALPTPTLQPEWGIQWLNLHHDESRALDVLPTNTTCIAASLDFTSVL